MRRFKRYICLVGLLALLAAALTGCGFSDDSVEELFTLPRMAEEYTGLTQELEALITQGYEYASPTGGRNIQSVQMADLDGDGQQEALAFFRMSSDEKPLKIFVFKIEGDSYARYCTIESSGTAIDSVYYQDLNGDGLREIIVGWRMTGGDAAKNKSEDKAAERALTQLVSVYSIERYSCQKVLETQYNRYVLTDLDLGKLSYLATQAAGMSFSGDMLRVTGDAVLGQGNRVELTVDQQALYDLILDVFYEEIPAPTDTAGE